MNSRIISHLIVQNRLILFGVACVLFISAAVAVMDMGIAGMQTDGSWEKHPTRLRYQAIMDRFFYDRDEDIRQQIFYIEVNKGNIFNSEYFLALRELSTSLAELPFALDKVSLIDHNRILVDDDFIEQKPLVNFDNDLASENWQDINNYVLSNDELLQYLVAEDGSGSILILEYMLYW